MDENTADYDLWDFCIMASHVVVRTLSPEPAVSGTYCHIGDICPSKNSDEIGTGYIERSFGIRTYVWGSLDMRKFNGKQVVADVNRAKAWIDKPDGQAVRFYYHAQHIFEKE